MPSRAKKDRSSRRCPAAAADDDNDEAAPDVPKEEEEPAAGLPAVQPPSTISLDPQHPHPQQGLTVPLLLPSRVAFLEAQLVGRISEGTPLVSRVAKLESLLYNEDNRPEACGLLQRLEHLEQFFVEQK